MPGNCLACDISQIHPVEFTIIKSRAMTLSRSPQCRAFSRAMTDEKSLTPLFPVGAGGVGQWLQMTGAFPLWIMPRNSVNRFTGRLDMT